MVEIILGTLLAFFSIVGMVEVAHSLWELFNNPVEKVTYVIALQGHSEKVEYIVRSIAFKASFLRHAKNPVIFVIDEGMDEQTRQICELLAEELNCITICSRGELPSLLGQSA